MNINSDKLTKWHLLTKRYKGKLYLLISINIENRCFELNPMLSNWSYGPLLILLLNTFLHYHTKTHINKNQSISVSNRMASSNKSSSKSYYKCSNICMYLSLSLITRIFLNNKLKFPESASTCNIVDSSLDTKVRCSLRYLLRWLTIILRLRSWTFMR